VSNRFQPRPLWGDGDTLFDLYHLILGGDALEFFFDRWRASYVLQALEYINSIAFQEMI
jgi:hypothetical protein